MGDKTTALTFNSGSSSVKYGLFEVEPGTTDLKMLCSGLVDKIGIEGTVIKHKNAVTGKEDKLPMNLPDHGAALKKVAELLTAAGGPINSGKDIKVVGHRVVHGGETFSQPAVVDEKGEAEIDKCTTLAPLHNPANLKGIRMGKELWSHAPQVAIFDTAFHATMPPESYRYAVPLELYEKHGVRRYGFHGTSYKYVTSAAARHLGRPAKDLNMIMCHLGNGASMCCIKGGKSHDTTMGLTPLEGMVMGTRSGDIDAGVYTHLCNHVGMSPAEVDTLLNKKSGLLGVAGLSDMRDTKAAAAKGDERAMLARKLYIERIRKYLGAFLVKLNGKCDALVFTAGVGENDRDLPLQVCDGLLALGIEVDSAKNAAVDGFGEVQSERSRIKVLIVPTDEEREMAMQSLVLCGFMQEAPSKL